jgi:hypothetical protein
MDRGQRLGRKSANKLSGQSATLGTSDRFNAGARRNQQMTDCRTIFVARLLSGGKKRSRPHLAPSLAAMPFQHIGMKPRGSGPVTFVRYQAVA